MTDPLKRLRNPRYKALPMVRRGDLVWIVYDTLEQRSVARMLPVKACETLAHTLNVADLTVPAKTFGDP